MVMLLNKHSGVKKKHNQKRQIKQQLLIYQYIRNKSNMNVSN